MGQNSSFTYNDNEIFICLIQKLFSITSKFTNFYPGVTSIYNGFCRLSSARQEAQRNLSADPSLSLPLNDFPGAAAVTASFKDSISQLNDTSDIPLLLPKASSVIEQASPVDTLRNMLGFPPSTCFLIYIYNPLLLSKHRKSNSLLVD